MDGYPSGMGNDLKTFLKPFTIVNGIDLADERKIANGMGCLAAQLIKELKDGAGNIYVYPPGSTDCGEEYIYTIEGKEDEKITLTCASTYRGILYCGPVSDFDAKAAEQKKSDLETEKS